MILSFCLENLPMPTPKVPLAPTRQMPHVSQVNVGEDLPNPGRRHHALTMGHFIKHIAGREPCTHHGGWESSCPCTPEGLDSGSVGMEEEGHDRHRG